MVVFDCDGVLVDSEPLSMRSWQRALAGFGWEMSDDDLQQFVGTTDRLVAEHYARRLGVEADELDAANSKAVIDTLATEGVPVFTDTQRLLDRLDGFGRIGVGSNSARWRLDALLAASGLGDRFAVSVSADEVPEPKPAPYVYEKVIDRLAAAAADTLVIEDSPTGIAAAKGTGATVVAVDRGMFDRAELEAADLIVDRLA